MKLQKTHKWVIYFSPLLLEPHFVQRSVEIFTKNTIFFQDYPNVAVYFETLCLGRSKTFQN